MPDELEQTQTLEQTNPYQQAAQEYHRQWFEEATLQGLSEEASVNYALARAYGKWRELEARLREEKGASEDEIRSKRVLFFENVVRPLLPPEGPVFEKARRAWYFPEQVQHPRLTELGGVVAKALTPLEFLLPRGKREALETLATPTVTHPEIEKPTLGTVPRVATELAALAPEVVLAGGVGRLGLQALGKIPGVARVAQKATQAAPRLFEVGRAGPYGEMVVKPVGTRVLEEAAGGAVFGALESGKPTEALETAGVFALFPVAGKALGMTGRALAARYPSLIPHIRRFHTLIKDEEVVERMRLALAPKVPRLVKGKVEVVARTPEELALVRKDVAQVIERLKIPEVEKRALRDALFGKPPSYSDIIEGAAVLVKRNPEAFERMVGSLPREDATALREQVDRFLKIDEDFKQLPRLDSIEDAIRHTKDFFTKPGQYAYVFLIKETNPKEALRLARGISALPNLGGIAVVARTGERITALTAVSETPPKVIEEYLKDFRDVLTVTGIPWTKEVGAKEIAEAMSKGEIVEAGVVTQVRQPTPPPKPQAQTTLGLKKEEKLSRETFTPPEGVSLPEERRKALEEALGRQIDEFAGVIEGVRTRKEADWIARKLALRHKVDEKGWKMWYDVTNDGRMLFVIAPYLNTRRLLRNRLIDAVEGERVFEIEEIKQQARNFAQAAEFAAEVPKKPAKEPPAPEPQVPETQMFERVKKAEETLSLKLRYGDPTSEGFFIVTELSPKAPNLDLALMDAQAMLTNAGIEEYVADVVFNPSKRKYQIIARPADWEKVVTSGKKESMEALKEQLERAIRIPTERGGGVAGIPLQAQFEVRPSKDVEGVYELVAFTRKGERPPLKPEPELPPEEEVIELTEEVEEPPFDLEEAGWWQEPGMKKLRSSGSRLLFQPPTQESPSLTHTLLQLAEAGALKPGNEKLIAKGLMQSRPGELYHITPVEHVSTILSYGILPTQTLVDMKVPVSAITFPLTKSVSLARSKSSSFISTALKRPSAIIVVDESLLTTYVGKSKPTVYRPEVRGVTGPHFAREFESIVPNVPVQAIKRVELYNAPPEMVETVEALGDKLGIEVFDMSEQGIKKKIQEITTLSQVLKVPRPGPKSPGHQRLWKALDEYVSLGVLHPEDAELLKYVFKDTDDKLLSRISYRVTEEGVPATEEGVFGGVVYGEATVLKPRSGTSRPQFELALHPKLKTLSADPSATFLHEYMHIAWEAVLSEADRVTVTKILTEAPTEDLKSIVTKALSYLYGRQTPAIAKILESRMEESWVIEELVADMFSSYVLAEKVPVEGLKKVFSRAWNYLRKVLSKLSVLREDETRLYQRLKPIFDKALKGQPSEEFLNAHVRAKYKSAGYEPPSTKTTPDMLEVVLGAPKNVTDELGTKVPEFKPPDEVISPPPPQEPEYPLYDFTRLGWFQAEYYFRPTKERFRALQERTNLPLYDSVYLPLTRAQKDAEVAMRPYLMELQSIFGGMSVKDRELVSMAMEGEGMAFTPKIRKAAERLRKWYDNLYKELEIEAPYIFNYLPHIRQYGLDSALMARKELSGKHKFFADMIRHNAELAWERDALVLSMKYLREGMWNRHVAPVFDTIVKIVRNAEWPAAVTNALERWLRAVRGFPPEDRHALLTGLQWTFERLGMETKKAEKLALTVSETLLHSMYGGALGFRVGAAVRNFAQILITGYPYLGSRALIDGMMRALTKAGREEAIRDRVLSEAFVAPRAGVWAPIEKLVQVSLTPYRVIDDFNRVAVYLGAKHKALRAFSKGGSIEKMMRKSGADMLSDTDRQLVREYLEKKQYQQAAIHLANEIQEITQFVYRAGAAPEILRNSYAGRVFGMFGTYPAQYIEWLRGLVGAGTSSARAIKLARAAAIHSLIVALGAMFGRDTSSWVFFGPGFYAGGPPLQAIIEISRLAGGTDYEKRLARVRLIRLSTLLIPGSQAARDFAKAINEFDKGDDEALQRAITILTLGVGSRPLKQ